MRPTLTAAVCACILLSAAGARAVPTVGAEYCQHDACGDATISNTKPDAKGFVNMMSFFGFSPRFLMGNTNFWPEDEVDCSVPGGIDCYYGDSANLTFFSTHGGSNSARFAMTTGVTHTIDGLSTCKSYTSSPTTGKQWWKLGNTATRIVSLSTCQGLQLEHLGHWDGVVSGLHMITGFHGSESDSPSVGSSYAMLGSMGLSVKQAWFCARPSGNTAVVMAYGVSEADAVNRRDNESFYWSMAAAPAPSWRAWAWVN